MASFQEEDCGALLSLGKKDFVFPQGVVHMFRESIETFFRGPSEWPITGEFTKHVIPQI